jgi:hypothetical protein
MQRSKYPVYTNSNQIKHDFLRHLAHNLFGTHYGVDLFSNEQQLLIDLCGNVSTTLNTNIKSLLDEVSGNTVDASYNFTERLFYQLIRSDVGRERLNALSMSSGFTSFPFEAGDELQMKVVLYSTETQGGLVNVSQPTPRSYLIRLQMN